MPSQRMRKIKTKIQTKTTVRGTIERSTCITDLTVENKCYEHGKEVNCEEKPAPKPPVDDSTLPLHIPALFGLRPLARSLTEPRLLYDMCHKHH
jgi:hypothetical protein